MSTEDQTKSVTISRSTGASPSDRPVRPKHPTSGVWELSDSLDGIRRSRLRINPDREGDEYCEVAAKLVDAAAADDPTELLRSLGYGEPFPIADSGCVFCVTLYRGLECTLATSRWPWVCTVSTFGKPPRGLIAIRDLWALEDLLTKFVAREGDAG
jgi:hypothetical protein